MKRYEMMGLNYSKAYYDLKSTVVPAEDNNGVYWKLESKNKYGRIGYSFGTQSLELTYNNPIRINSSNIISARYYLDEKIVFAIDQTFTFSKSTGKKITLTTPPSNSYPGDGAFTLVNGIINEKGRERAHEILGFSGTDCEAVIDLGKEDTINNVTAHIFSQPAAWIWPPSSFTVQTSMDGINFNAIVDVGPPVLNENKVQLNFPAQITRYVKVFIKNKGIIPEGNPGAGKNAWLFVSEIMVN